MGLDAVVYRNKEHIELGRDEGRAIVEPVTGEVYFEDTKLERKYYRQRKAVSHRLGNITAIAVLREELTRLIGPDSMTVERIVYSGTHDGMIPLKDLPELSGELAGGVQMRGGIPCS